jgi:sterol desaturase/sphingolipid hydroxylase (fatty acid hydroxylase superfamily)
MKALLLLLLPVFLTTGFLELGIALRKRPGTYALRDTLANVALFLGSQVIGLGARVFHVPIFVWLYTHRFFELRAGVLTFVVLFFADDLAYYAYHRASHVIRLLWTSHEVHHSSTSYNLSVAGRQPWTSVFFGWIFWAPLALAGMRPEWIVVAQSLNLAYQFFLHTRLVGKLGPLEWVLNTPSHHRVHHGTETAYLDRNYGGVLIIWDRLFGTFTEEKAEPSYGILKPVHSNNPFVIVAHAWIDLARDVALAPSFSARVAYLVKPPGWRHDGSGATAADLQSAAADDPVEAALDGGWGTGDSA